MMAAVKNKNTAPERRVRRVLFRAGYRYRIHAGTLPGSPDIWFRAYDAVIFVHGCFWHHHDCPKGSRLPKRNALYWQEKIRRNVQRDARVRCELHECGVRVLYVWECALTGKGRLSEGALLQEMAAFLHDSSVMCAELP